MRTRAIPKSPYWSRWHTYPEDAGTRARKRAGFRFQRWQSTRNSWASRVSRVNPDPFHHSHFSTCQVLNMLPRASLALSEIHAEQDQDAAPYDRHGNPFPHQPYSQRGSHDRLKVGECRHIRGGKFLERKSVDEVSDQRTEEHHVCQPPPRLGGHMPPGDFGNRLRAKRDQQNGPQSENQRIQSKGIVEVCNLFHQEGVVSEKRSGCDQDHVAGAFF